MPNAPSEGNGPNNGEGGRDPNYIVGPGGYRVDGGQRGRTSTWYKGRSYDDTF